MQVGQVNMHLPDAWGYLVFADEALVAEPGRPVLLVSPHGMLRYLPVRCLRIDSPRYIAPALVDSLVL